MQPLNEFQPKDLDDAIDYILKFITAESRPFLEQYKDDERGFLSQLHMFFGMSLRNNWYLWWWKDHKYESWPDKKPLIVEWFNNVQIYHADDMSSIILTSAHRKYFEKPIQLDEQIKRYHKHWLKQCGTINPLEKNKN